MSDPQRLASNTLWLTWFVIIPVCFVVGLLGGAILASFKPPISSEVRDKTTIIYPSRSVQSHNSPASVEVTICRSVDSDAVSDNDYRVYFRTKEQVSFVNRGRKAVGLSRVDLTGLDNDAPWQVEVFELNRVLNLPTTIFGEMSIELQFGGTTIVDASSEASARQVAEELGKNPKSFNWSLILDSDLPIDFWTSPTVMSPGPITDCAP